MSTDIDQLEIDFYLNSSASVTELDTVEISHPSFSQVFRFTYNDADGFYANLETGQEVFFEYLPMDKKGSTLTTDLDYGINITLGDLGGRIQKELDRVGADDTFHITPVVRVRSYRSDRLDQPMRGPIDLEISNYTYNDDGFAFQAQAPDVKSAGTGELYLLERFSLMLAFFYA